MTAERYLRVNTSVMGRFRMTPDRVWLACALALLTLSAPAAANDHPLGMPHKVFCDAFVKTVAHKMPMRYLDFIKYTDGEGMPVSPEARHWDGLRNSYLTVILHLGFVKGGMVTCPNRTVLTFGAWDASGP